MENRFILEKNFLHTVCNRYNEDKSCEVVHKRPSHGSFSDLLTSCYAAMMQQYPTIE